MVRAPVDDGVRLRAEAGRRRRRARDGQTARHRDIRSVDGLHVEIRVRQCV